MLRAALVIALCTALPMLLASCTSSNGTRQVSGPPTRAEATTVLRGYAAALLHRDGQAFDAALDPATVAAGFRDQQQTDFADLAAVPLTQWTYTVLGSVPDATTTAREQARYGAPVLLVHVTLAYRLAGVDALPSSHDQYLTLTRRDGHVYLAGDDALAADFGPSWDGPWHYGPLAAVRGAHSLVLGPPALTATLRTLAAETDAAVDAVTAVWGRDWARTAAVVVPTSTGAYTQLSGDGLAEDDAAAVTESIDPASGRAAGQRVYLNPSRLSRLTTAGRGVVLRHEITHLAAAADTADITPRWLVEGLAEYVANLHSTQSVPTIAGELAAEVRKGRVPGALPTAATFGADPASAYEQAWLACRSIAREYGQAALLRFYRALGAALEPAAPALAHAFGTVLHTTQVSFTSRWRRDLEASLR